MTELVSYYDNRYVRALIQLVPHGIGSAIDVLLNETIEKMRTDRLRAFYTQLESGKIELTEEIIHNEDFLHCYFSTVRCVLNTSRKEKIEFFGKLFNKSIKASLIYHADDYEYYLKILDELTLVEIQILNLLNRLESKTNPVDQLRNHILSANVEIWKEFACEMKSQFNIDDYFLDETLIRIERTGCLYIPRITSNDLRPYAAMTTEIYRKLKELIVEQ